MLRGITLYQWGEKQLYCAWARLFLQFWTCSRSTQVQFVYAGSLSRFSIWGWQTERGHFNMRLLFTHTF